MKSDDLKSALEKLRKEALPGEFDQLFDEKNDQDADSAALADAWRIAGLAEPHFPKPDPERLKSLKADIGKQNKNRTARTIMYRMAAVLLAGFLGVAGWLSLPTQLSAPMGERISHTMPDGSLIELNSGATLTHNGWYGLFSRRLSLQGQAWFDVQKSSIPFVVTTNLARVEVLGTQFGVNSTYPQSKARSSEVILAEGSVRFSAVDTDKGAVTLTPGQASTVFDASSLPSQPRSANVDAALSWRTGGYFFNDQPLSLVLTDVMRREHVRIVFPSDLGDERISLHLPPPVTAELVLGSIAELKRLKLTGGDASFSLNHQNQ